MEWEAWEEWGVWEAWEECIDCLTFIMEILTIKLTVRIATFQQINFVYNRSLTFSNGLYRNRFRINLNSFPYL